MKILTFSVFKILEKNSPFSRIIFLCQTLSTGRIETSWKSGNRIHPADVSWTESGTESSRGPLHLKKHVKWPPNAYSSIGTFNSLYIWLWGIYQSQKFVIFIVNWKKNCFFLKSQKIFFASSFKFFFGATNEPLMKFKFETWPLLTS